MSELQRARGDGPGVSFVIPVLNGVVSIRDTIDSILRQVDGRPTEIIVVDDGSGDGSVELLERLQPSCGFTLIHGEGRGAAAAVNAGIRVARHPIICQVDQDVVLEDGWMSTLVAELDEPSVGAVQGYFSTDPHASLLARVMGLDLEDRYLDIGRVTDHVCTGNAAYRAEAVRRVGMFDETLGYGYDNDMSYRLRDAGYRLRLCPSARSVHRWREGIAGYLVQQYGFGYGRIDLVAKHPDRFGGDRVSPAEMMAHPLLMMVALAGFVAAFLVNLAGSSSSNIVAVSLAALAVLFAERTFAAYRAMARFRDGAALLFPVVHLMRDAAWVAAITVWLARRATARSGRPSHSMRPRQALNPARIDPKNGPAFHAQPRSSVPAATHHVP